MVQDEKVENVVRFWDYHRSIRQSSHDDHRDDQAPATIYILPVVRIERPTRKEKSR